MRLRVIGEKPDGRVYDRTVTPREFVEGWGPYAEFLWLFARTQTVVIEGHKVRVVVIP